MEIKDSTLVSMATLAAICGFSSRHGNRLVKAGVLHPVKRGKYDLASSVQAYVHYMADGAEANSDIAAERKRLLRAQANHEELKVQQRKGELTPVADVEAVFAESMVIVGTQLDGLSGRMAGDLAGIGNPAEIRTKLLTETRRIRTAAAEKLEQYIGKTGG